MKRILLVFLISIISLIVYAPTIVKCIYIIESPVTRLYSLDFIRFANHLGYVESHNNPNQINVIGCFGEYQFKQSTLHYLGYTQITLKRFKRDPGIFPKEIQLDALNALLKVNKTMLNPYRSYIGNNIKGITITQSGLLAAAHLGGYNNVKLYLTSNGKINKHDRFGTSISKYIKEFAGYSI